MKEFTLNGIRYEVSTGSAIALCELDEGESARQRVLIVDDFHDGIRNTQVVFNGWPVPQSDEDMLEMFESWGDWENDQDVLDTIERD